MSSITPPPQRGLRLPLSASERRVLGGYGPLAALLTAFLSMAVFVPTVGRSSQVAATTAPSGGTTSSSGSSTPGTSPAAGTATTLAGGPPTTLAGALAGTAAASGAGAAAAPAHTASCSGPQVKGDPYSPPCVVFSGNNGGATSPGVSANTITVAFRQTNDPGFQQVLAELGGAQFADSPQDVQRTVNGLADYFNSRFQFYGRKLKVVYYTGQGSQSNELLGQGQAQADADAITVGQQIHAFADLSSTTEPYGDALYRQHVLAFGVPYLSRQWMAQRQPYEWSIATDCNSVVDTTSEFVDKELGNGPAAFAGPGLQGKPRRIAIISPDNPWYQDCANEAIKIMKAQGVQVVDDIQYQLNLATLSNQAASVIAKLSNDGITTVVCGCDPVFPVYLTSRAHEQSYSPEWVVAGVALTDADIVGQLFDQSEWSHAFGVSYSGDTPPKRGTLGYNAYKLVRNDEPANAVDLIYAQMYQLAMGLQLAGPNLTPQSFQQGMFSYQGSVANAPAAQLGTWGFPVGHWTPQVDSRIIYWDPNKISTFNGKQGAYVQASPRYRQGQYPTGSPHVFGH
jgi:hypothetical protein